MKARPEKIRRCKYIAFTGVLIMGVGSFLSCLAQGETGTIIGSGCLILGIALAAYGFMYWRP